MSVLVIAEPGGIGQGDYTAMVRLLETAHACGANVWKPQFTTDAEQHLERRSARLSAKEKAEFYATYREAYHWLQWPAEWHAAFRQRCHDLGMQYACSVCLPRDVAIVAPFVDYIKVSSFESGDAGLMEAVEASGVESIASYGFGQEEYNANIRLHCVSAYPAPIDQMNLWCINHESGDSGYGGYDGLSDHSRNRNTGAVAVAIGATVIEAHYRLGILDCDPNNPDFEVSFAPDEFAQYIQNIRDAEIMLGNGMKTIQPCEAEMARYRVTT